MFIITEDEDNRKVEACLKDIAMNTTHGVRQAFYSIGEDLQIYANKDILRKPRGGKVYRYKGRNHVASIRGEAFANRSGDARRTLGFTVSGSDSMEFGFKKNEDTEYVEVLEDRDRLNRRTLRIAINANRRNMRSHFERELEKSLKEGHT